jgi:hypothetical protein
VNKRPPVSGLEHGKEQDDVSLDRKDVRLRISADAHRELVAIAELYEKDISEFASTLLERSLLGESHAAKLYAERVARWGKSGTAGGTPAASPGTSGKTKLRGV